LTGVSGATEKQIQRGDKPASLTKTPILTVQRIYGYQPQEDETGVFLDRRYPRLLVFAPLRDRA